MKSKQPTITFDMLSETINNELTIYSENVIDGVKKQAKKSMTQLVKQTKATAPVGKSQKHYRDSIASKKLTENYRSISYLWYVKGSDYRLSHLLEKGHALRNGGRSKAFHFIEKATDSAIESYEKGVEEVIKNG